MSYTPLHVHSEYSLLDGLSKTSQIASRIKDIGATSCALTDHGTVSGAVDFVKTMKDNGLISVMVIQKIELQITKDCSIKSFLLKI